MSVLNILYKLLIDSICLQFAIIKELDISVRLVKEYRKVKSRYVVCVIVHFKYLR